MIDTLNMTSTRSLTAPLRGTQPLDLKSAKSLDSQSSLIASTGIPLDESFGLNGTSRLAAYAQDPAVAELRSSVNRLLQSPHLSVMDRQQLVAIRNKLDQDGAFSNDFLDDLAFAKGKVAHIASITRQKAELANKEQRQLRESADNTWRQFYESLERYIENLKSLSKVEESVTSRKLNESRAESKFVDRLLTAAAALIPGQAMTLLSAKLAQKA